MRLPLVISVGDPAGVGPDIAVRAVADRLAEDAYLLVGDAPRLQGAWAKVTGGSVPLEVMAQEHISKMRKGEARVVDVGPAPDGCVAAHAPSVEGGSWQLRALTSAADLVAQGAGRALVTGPVSKEAISLSGVVFTGQTEFLAERAGLARDAVTMLFLGPRLKVGLVTTHLAVADVSSGISPERVTRSIRHVIEAKRQLARTSSKVTICVTGLNPHAGEGGLLGGEELRVIGPTLAALRYSLAESDPDVCLVGPTPAESAFRQAAAGDIDAVVAMYHDQATIASKLLDFGEAVNVTWGLPFVRTSVDHGVAYDAAARGDASHSGMEAALRMAGELEPVMGGR